MIDQLTELLLEDMLDNARAALEFIEGFDLDRFAGDRRTLFATTRAVEIVGEAASQVSTEARAAMPSIPWRPAIDMRNRLIHGYRRLDAETVLKTVREDFPPLIAELERILNERPNDGA